MSGKISQKMIRNAFMEIADAIEQDCIVKKPIIGVAIESGEHGSNNIRDAFRLIEEQGYKAVEIDGESIHEKMENLLALGEIDAAVTTHYPFPIGTATVGKIITPGRGKAVYIASTTGASDTNRAASLVKNAIYGIIAAKACGKQNPSVGIVNIDGARQCEMALQKLKENGYEINFAESDRTDGGSIMRGNDLLSGTADVMVMDSLTGNLIMKIFSAYTTGGAYESIGWGYGPGIGEEMSNITLIVSRASGAPVISGAVQYASDLAQHNVIDIARTEFRKADNAGLIEIINELKRKQSAGTVVRVSTNKPTKEPVLAQIAGIDVMDLEDAVELLLDEQIYAESGMGCTGPIIRVSDTNKPRAEEILSDSGYLK